MKTNETDEQMEKLIFPIIATYHHHVTHHVTRKQALKQRFYDGVVVQALKQRFYDGVVVQALKQRFYYGVVVQALKQRFYYGIIILCGHKLFKKNIYYA